MTDANAFSATVRSDRSSFTVNETDLRTAHAVSMALEGALSHFLGEDPNGNRGFLIHHCIANGLAGQFNDFRPVPVTCGTEKLFLPAVMR